MVGGSFGVPERVEGPAAEGEQNEGQHDEGEEEAPLHAASPVSSTGPTGVAG